MHSAPAAPPSALDDDYRCFCERYPAYLDTLTLDDLRARDYARLDSGGDIYLDYTGGGLYALSQIQQHMSLLAGGVYGNPHSSNPTSQAATTLAEHARAHVLHYFNADPAEYIVIFTANASGALKLVGESYPFVPGGRYLLTFDNHNSVNGIREFAAQHGARVVYTPVMPPDLRIDAARLEANLAAIDRAHPHLFAFPAQSNFSGVQHDLSWVDRAQGLGWDVLLDAAAFAPTNRLDLSVVRPEFISLSFYKMFGYPTGVGALIAKRSAVARLRRPWFAGGTIRLATVTPDTHTLHEGAEAFEDGTIDYLNLPAVEIGLRHLEAANIDTVHTRVACLTGWLLDQLTDLRHADGSPAVRVYGPITTDRRGGTIAFNFYDAAGALVDYRSVERLANARRLSLRSGCFCNPGAGETALDLTSDDLEGALSVDPRLSLGELMLVLDRVIGALRISVGLASNFADAAAFVAFARAVVAEA
ncbi:MAG: aminotransferase class V-fold PLP-dependent enzyme [Chloroflexota bacterium]|nr:aminotransferase class V-fold PLP-dependent enzyme [Chloroflexota bacterium]